MKKYIILTSILALTACGGGSGSGGGSAPIMPDAPVMPEEPFVDPIAISNSEITSMISNSEYQVARYVAYKLGDYAADVNLSRTATTRGAFVPQTPTGDTDYDTARELIDLAAWLVDDTTSESDIVEMFNKSTLDKNKIKSALKLMDDMYCFVGGDAVETARRIKDKDFDEPLADLNKKTEVLSLSNTDFTTADEGFDLKIRFNLDNQTQSEIVGITLFGADENPNEDGIVFERANEQDSNGYIFNGQITVEEGAKADAQLVYTSVANTEKVGLRYSDFGNIEIRGYDEEAQEFVSEQKLAFIGGYDSSKRIETPGETTFTGLATGGVTAVRNGEGSGEFLALDTATNTAKDKVATLEFNDGNTTLTAKFDNWYDIVFTETNTGTKSATFNNYSGSDSFKMVSDTGDRFTVNNMQYQEYEEGEPVFDNGQPVKNDSINSEFRYYGDNDIASESVGLIQIRDRGTDPENYDRINDYGDENNPRPEVRVNISFGGIADNN